MTRIHNWQDYDDEIEEMEADEARRRIDAKRHKQFRSGMSLDNRKRGKIRREQKQVMEE
jgi:hypothetical protein